MIQLFSVCSSMEYQPGAEWSLPVGAERPEEEAPAQSDRRSARSLIPRRRARAAAGRFQADNPATPDNEAWQQEEGASGDDAQEEG